MAIAERMLDRHHTLTKFLIALGIDAATAETDACKIEHDISQKTFDAICAHAKAHLCQKRPPYRVVFFVCPPAEAGNFAFTLPAAGGG